MLIKTQQIDYNTMLDDIHYGVPFREFVGPNDKPRFPSVYMKCSNRFATEDSNKTIIIDLADGYAVNMPKQTRVIVVNACVVENVVKGKNDHG